MGTEKTVCVCVLRRGGLWLRKFSLYITFLKVVQDPEVKFSERQRM